MLTGLNIASLSVCDSPHFLAGVFFLLKHFVVFGGCCSLFQAGSLVWKCERCVATVFLVTVANDLIVHLNQFCHS